MSIVQFIMSLDVVVQRLMGEKPKVSCYIGLRDKQVSCYMNLEGKQKC